MELSAITAGFSQEPEHVGRNKLQRYQAGDVIVAYASRHGALGFGIALGFDSYTYSDFPRHGSDHRHEVQIAWQFVAWDITDGIPASKLTGRSNRHPRSTSVEIDESTGAAIVDVLREKFTAFPKDLSIYIQELERNPNLTPTEKEQLVKARIGHANFRSSLEKIWQQRCALTGCMISAALRASHIKPWSIATDHERLDPNNGLLLVANADALFDRGLISFKEDGSLVAASYIDLASLGLPDAAKLNFSSATAEYMKFHYQNVFVGAN